MCMDGSGDHKNVLNIPVDSREGFTNATQTVLNTLDTFRPSFIFISAGKPPEITRNNPKYHIHHDPPDIFRPFSFTFITTGSSPLLTDQSDNPHYPDNPDSPNNPGNPGNFLVPSIGFGGHAQDTHSLELEEQDFDGLTAAIMG